MMFNDVREQFGLNVKPIPLHILRNLRSHILDRMLKQMIRVTHQGMMPRSDPKYPLTQLGCCAPSGVGICGPVVQQFAEGFDATEWAVAFIRKDPLDITMQLNPTPPRPGTVDIEHLLRVRKIMCMLTGRQPIRQDPLSLKVVLGNRMFSCQHEDSVRRAEKTLSDIKRWPQSTSAWH
jgi:hypothetical protein